MMATYVFQRFLIPALLVILLAAGPSLSARSVGDVLLDETFETAKSLERWTPTGLPGVTIVQDGAGHVLQIENKGEVEAINYELPAEEVRGMRLRVQAKVRAEGVSQPPKPWNGIKVMMRVKSPAMDDYPQATLDTGTFDWRDVDYLVRVPDDANLVQLVLGLELSTGKVWFDDLKVSIAELPKAKAPLPELGPVFKGHDLPRLGGAMIPTRATEKDLRDLAALGANHVRWQLTWNSFPHSPADTASPEVYDAWLEDTLKHVDSLLPLCRELGLKVLVDVHTAPGGITEKKAMRLFSEKAFQDQLIRVWDKIARRYKGEPAIWGYDLLNEPIEGPIAPGLMNWQDLTAELTRTVRAVDPDRAIIIEAAPGGSAKGLVDFVPLDDPNIVYSFHLYEPHAFTHQKIYDDYSDELPYPGEIQGRLWDKERLRLLLTPVVEWQREHQVHIYVGEFSAVRWAPGDSAERYLRDSIELFEEFRWDWAYHAFREWHGWSFEHGTDKENTAPDADPGARHRLMTEWFGKNHAK